MGEGVCRSGRVAPCVEAGGAGMQGSAAVRAVCVCEAMCVRGCQSRCDGTDAWALDRWGRAVRVDLGHSVLSLGQLGPLGLRDLLPTTSFGAQSQVSLLCLSLLPHRASPSLSCSLWPDRQQLHGCQRAGVLGGLSEPHAFP